MGVDLLHRQFESLRVVLTGIPVATIRRDGVEYAVQATAQQRADGNALFAAFDWAEAAQANRDANANPDRKSLRDAAAQAGNDIDTYLAIGSPTNAQVVAQVRRLSQNQKQLIKRLIQID